MRGSKIQNSRFFGILKSRMLDPAESRKCESLRETATVALEFGLLMESGASARNVEEITRQVAVGLGAESVDIPRAMLPLCHHRRHRARRTHPNAQSRAGGESAPLSCIANG
jgi:hypothetical protein